MREAWGWLDKVRTVEDFPLPGVRFRDLLPVLWDVESRARLLADLEAAVRPLGSQWLVAPEARGFLLAAMLADRLQLALLPVRKPGKLPPPVVEEPYALEYGQASLQAPATLALAGARCVVVDDVLATGGTVLAAAHLVARMGGRVAGFVFAVELAGLGGRQRLGELGVPVVALASLDA